MERGKVPRGKRPRVQVSMEDKERAIERIRNGETKAGISRELGVPESTVRGWVKRADQRMAREASESKTTESVAQSSLVAQAQKPATKRDSSGQPKSRPKAPAPARPVAMPLPMPMQVFQQAASNQLELNGWLQIFNAGILNFTLIATAAYLRARMRGTTERQTLWQIICEYVDDAARNVAANGGQYVLDPDSALTIPITHPAQPAPLSGGIIECDGDGGGGDGGGGGGGGGIANGGFVAPRLHITAEDDEDASMDADESTT